MTKPESLNSEPTSPDTVQDQIYSLARELTVQAINLRTRAKTAEDYDELTSLYNQIEKLYAPSELSPSLKKQYEEQFSILNRTAFIELNNEGRLSFVGVDGKDYPLPTPAEIAGRIEAKKEFIEKKQKQGFTKLLMVPFGRKFDDFIDRFETAVLEHKTAGEIFATKKNPDDGGERLVPIPVRQDEPLFITDMYKNAEKITANGINLVYQPEVFSETNSQGKTKQQILNKHGGWRILLVEDMPNIPKAGAGKKIGDRPQIEAGISAEGYLYLLGKGQGPVADMLREKYDGEHGMTPEDQLMYAITQLEETNQVIDDEKGYGTASLQIGAYFQNSNLVPFFQWDRTSRQAQLGGADPQHINATLGARMAVEI